MNRTLVTSNHVALRWSVCGRREPITGISSTESPMARVQPTPMTESAASTRVCGDSLARTILLVSAFWVRLFKDGSLRALTVVLTCALGSHPWPYVSCFSHEMVPFHG